MSSYMGDHADLADVQHDVDVELYAVEMHDVRCDPPRWVRMSVQSSHDAAVRAIDESFALRSKRAAIRYRILRCEVVDVEHVDRRRMI